MSYVVDGIGGEFSSLSNAMLAAARQPTRVRSRLTADDLRLLPSSKQRLALQKLSLTPPVAAATATLPAKLPSPPPAPKSNALLFAVAAGLVALTVFFIFRNKS